MAAVKSVEGVAARMANVVLLRADDHVLLGMEMGLLLAVAIVETEPAVVPRLALLAGCLDP